MLTDLNLTYVAYRSVFTDSTEFETRFCCEFSHRAIPGRPPSPEELAHPS